jgi:NADPH-dependent F420 reductase
MSTSITIIGAGNMGRGIAYVAARGDNHATIIDRDPQEATKLVREVRGEHPEAVLEVGSLDLPITSEVIVLAVWYTAAQDLARQLADQLAGKIVVDISNPLNETFDSLAIAGNTSAAEELARLIPDSRVVKAFNTTFAGTLVQGQVAGQPLDVLVAGDAPDAKRVAIDLVRAGGLRGIDVGPLERARQLEGLGFLGISLQASQGTNFASAWKFLA